MKLSIFTLVSTSMILSLFALTDPSYAIEWKPYTNEKYGFSLQIPANWNVTEKQNRFEDATGPDLIIRNPNNENQGFAITDHNYEISKYISLNGMEQLLFGRADLYKILDNVVVEGPDLSQFKINGYPTGTIVLYNKGNESVYQEFIVDRNGKAALLEYSNSVDQFDSPESQEILNHMIASIKFN